MLVLFQVRNSLTLRQVGNGKLPQPQHPVLGREPKMPSCGGLSGRRLWGKHLWWAWQKKACGSSTTAVWPQASSSTPVAPKFFLGKTEEGRFPGAFVNWAWKHRKDLERWRRRKVMWAETQTERVVSSPAHQTQAEGDRSGPLDARQDEDFGWRFRPREAICPEPFHLTYK